MIQVRRNIFETNSSSTHCLTIMDRDMYDDWRNEQIAVSIQYIYNTEDKDKNFGRDPEIRLPLNFNTPKQAKNIAKEKDGDENYDYRYHGLSNGDDGFMRTWGNFDTYAPVVRTVEIDKQVEENVKLLNDYIRTSKWYMDYLKESGKYDHFLELVKQYEETGEFTVEMYSAFPNYLYYTADEYYEMLSYDDCYSPFIHAFKDYVAFGYWFHS